MGNTLHQFETDFFIAKEFKPEALALLKNFTENKDNLAFVNQSEIVSAPELEEALTALRWIPENNENGDIVEINFEGEKLGDDYQMFDSIAKVVRNGSYITALTNNGENSKIWRWLFLNEKLTAREGKLIF